MNDSNHCFFATIKHWYWRLRERFWPCEQIGNRYVLGAVPQWILRIPIGQFRRNYTGSRGFQWNLHELHEPAWSFSGLTSQAIHFIDNSPAPSILVNGYFPTADRAVHWRAAQHAVEIYVRSKIQVPSCLCHPLTPHVKDSLRLSLHDFLNIFQTIEPCMGSPLRQSPNTWCSNKQKEQDNPNRHGPS